MEKRDRKTASRQPTRTDLFFRSFHFASLASCDIFRFVPPPSRGSFGVTEFRPSYYLVLPRANPSSTGQKLCNSLISGVVYLGLLSEQTSCPAVRTISFHCLHRFL